MEIYSIQAVAEATGMRPYQLKYFLETNGGLVPDRRLNVGMQRYRWFTQEDIDLLVSYLQGGLTSED